MKKESAVFCILVMTLLILSACEGLQFGSSAEFNPEVHTGSEGLRVEILKNTPPTEIYEDEQFKVVVRLINKGAYAINDGVVSLTYEKEFVDLLNDRKKTFDLKGKDVYNMWDDEELAVFDLRSKLLDKMSEIHTSLLLLTNCYDYETIASFQACIDTNIYKTRPVGEEVCSVKDLTSSGQGGPLVITRVEQDISGGEYIIPHFKIYIRNKGNGEVIRYGKKEEACSSVGIVGDDYNVIDLVNVELSNYKLSDGDIKCSPELIKLKDREVMIRCYLDRNVIKNNDPSFVTSLKIHLRYSYTETEAMLMDILNDESKDKEETGEKIYDKGDEPCINAGGTCKWIGEGCNGEFVPNLCLSEPSTNYKCCIPKEGTGGVGINIGVHCNKEPFTKYYCYDLSDGKICPQGFEDVKNHCLGYPTYVRCCIKPP